jgi:hypothetical protein
MKVMIAMAACAASLFAAAGASAAAYPDGGVTANQVAAALQAGGYQAEVTKDSSGDPMIRSAADGTKYRILFYGCKSTPRCTALEFLVGFDLSNGMTMEKLNKWNRDSRFGHAYLDDENDPYLQLDLNSSPGFTSESMGSYIDTWTSLVPKFKTYIGF